ncbi:MAG: hypothetical protein NZ480_05175, partial [Bdellovibrionaceae bacterium]|nr:hypothetical protein [Pseudobdellovibrionaceae bacterium]
MLEVLNFRQNKTREGEVFSQVRAILKDHPQLWEWILEVATLTEPQGIYVCNGSETEFQAIIKLLVDKGTLRPLNPQKRPHSYLAWSDPSDVARVEDRTYVCTEAP